MTIGYTRVSTSEQNISNQVEILKENVCEKVFTDIASGVRTNREGLNEMLSYLRKDDIIIVYKTDGYFRKRWKISADTIFEFDEDYFEDKDRRDLYVFLSALVDKNIFEYLNYIWHHIYHEDLSMEIINTRIYKLKEKGVKF